jgi:hypothetical protein
VSWSRRSSTSIGWTASSETWFLRTGQSSRDSVSETATGCVATRWSGLRSDFAAWSGSPIFAYGFEDLTGAEWELIEVLAARTDVTLSVPYEPGRAAFAALTRTVEDLATLAGPSIEELPRPPPGRRPRHSRGSSETCSPTTRSEGPLDGAIRFLEGAGTRGTSEVLAAELATLLRGGTAPESVAVVCESVDRWRAPLEAAFAQLDVPYAVEHPRRLGDTAFGGRCCRSFGTSGSAEAGGDLFAFLRSPFSGLERRSVDFVEGRLRGRAVSDRSRVEEESETPPRGAGARARGPPCLRGPACRRPRLIATMVRSAWGLESPAYDRGRAARRPCLSAQPSGRSGSSGS